MKEPMTAEEVGKFLFEATVDDKLCSNLRKLFESSDHLIFQSPVRDTTVYSVLIPEIDLCQRNGLKILRIEMMHYFFFIIDYLLMRSAQPRENWSVAGEEILSWYIWEFRKRVEPTGKSGEFLALAEARLRAYSEAWDTMLADDEKRN